MVVINGRLIPDKEAAVSMNNRGFTYGDSVFETVKYASGNILFWEDHYFRLMAAMRILRMDIPMTFTPEFLESEVLRVIDANNWREKALRVKLQVSRKAGGLYMPESNHVDYFISATELTDHGYHLSTNSFRVDLFKDFFISPGLLSTLKTNNRLINVLGSIYATENELDNCLLLNTDKSVVEGLSGNLFVVKGKQVKTPPLSDGCLKGVMRKQILEIISEMEDLEILETSISPFELQKADEMFLTNVISGVVSVTNYRKKEYNKAVSSRLISALNSRISN